MSAARDVQELVKRFERDQRRLLSGRIGRLMGWCIGCMG